MNRWKKPLRILLTLAAVLVAGAVILGILNGLLADGAWTFGWSAYSYDDELYQAGDGSIPAEQITAISLDWVDGTVTLEACHDAYASVTESAESQLTEAAQLRWYVSEDGVLSVKYRASSYFLSGKNKSLVLRIPVEFLEGLEIKVKTNSANVILKELTGCDVEIESQSGGAAVLSDCDLTRFSATTGSGKLLISGGVREQMLLSTRTGTIRGNLPFLPRQSNLFCGKGDIELTLPQDASFSLGFSSEKGNFTCAFDLAQADGRWICGTGEARLDVKTEKGNMSISK
ncbi:MAG: DUF4097 family beta strand repeat protein [Clostridia bacterium]|nr:DUF4097 family beta strand repeat protein [Clostridia bacterium]